MGETTRLTRVLELTSLGTRVRVELVGLDEGDCRDVVASWSRCSPRLLTEDGPAAAVDLRAGLRLSDEGTVAGCTAESHDQVPVRAPGPHDVVADSVDALRQGLTSAVTEVVIERRRGDLLLLHAGAVCDVRTGAAVVLVAPSGHGKTTAATTLGRHFGYVTDETAGVDDDGRLVPHPKPLSVRPPVQPGPSRPKAQVSPDALGLVPLDGTRPVVRRVLLLDRRDDVEGARLEPTGIAEVADRLFGQISYLGARTAPLRRLHRLAEATGGLAVVRYRESDELVNLVAALLAEPLPDGRPAGSPLDLRPAEVDPPGDPEATVGPVGGAPRAGAPSARCLGVDRSRVRDWLDEDDAVVVLVGDTLHVLQGIGVDLWRAAVRGDDDVAAVDAVVAEHGPPGGDDPDRARALVAQARADLVSAGVLLP